MNGKYTKMLRWLLKAACVLIPGIDCSFGQNLVQNPGLDIYTTCPGFGQFGSTWIPFWEKPTIASSDYYHFNCAGIQPSVQTPHSGEGYAGIICYNFGTEYREYITGTLSAPLTAGTAYDVEFWVSLNNGYIQAIEEVGAYLSASPPGPFVNALHIAVTPQVENASGALNDTMNWKKISGQFVAAGGEMYITLGNFHDDAGTTITQPGTTGSFGSYYFIEDVSVTEHTNTGTGGEPGLNNIRCYFENGSMVIRVDAARPEWFPAQFRLFDVTGRLLHSTTITGVETRISTGNTSGVLLFEMVSAADRRQCGKIAAFRP